MDNSWKNKFIVAAIDFGTTFSGFALSFLSDYKANKTNILTYHWKPGDQPITHKTPTCLLLNPDKTFHSFGYDAEEKYAELAEDKEHKQWHYFKRFKMKLYNSAKTNNCGLSFQSTIKDIEGRDIEAMTVFSHSLAYMKRKIVEVVREKSPFVREDDIHYVLTTPAIWSEQAKLFMRKAARNAHIPDERLRIALEPECAAVYVYTKELPAVDLMHRDKKAMREGSCHLIIDLGGGTLDIAAHRVVGDCQFEEIMPPDGGAWGADNINLKFEQFLLKITGGPAFKEFKDHNMDDYLTIQRTFEHKKCAFTGDGNQGKVTISLPESFRGLHEKHNKETMSASIGQTSHFKELEMKNEKMRLNTRLFRSFFTDTVTGVLTTIERVMSELPEEIDTIICVGGFSDCVILKKAFREKFPKKNIIIPQEAVTAIMKGAIIFAREQPVKKRMARHTYGLDWNEDFDPNVHDPQKLEQTDDGDLCRDIFKKLIGKGEPVPYNKPTQEIEAYVKSKYQQFIDFPFYRSEILPSPQYIDEIGCHLIGTMRVNLQEGVLNRPDRCVRLKVYFGATELKAEAEDDTGKKYDVTFNLEETQV